MLELLRKTYLNDFLKKIYLIKLKSIIYNNIIPSWRIQRYQIIYNKNNYNKEKIININDNITNIIWLLNYLRYKSIFDKYPINIEIFTLLLNNLCDIFYFYNINLDELFEYIINNNNINNINHIFSITSTFSLSP